MNLKLNISKQGLSTTEEVINEEYTLRYGHIFRGLSAYEQAVQGGYVGSKQEFSQQLGKINNMVTTDDIVHDFDGESTDENSPMSAELGNILYHSKIEEVEYNSVLKALVFYADKNKTKPVTSISAKPFIKDGMIDKVSINPDTQIITITFNTDAGKEDIEVDLATVLSGKINVVPGKEDNIPMFDQDGQLTSSDFTKKRLQKMDDTSRVIEYETVGEEGDIFDYNSILSPTNDDVSDIADGCWRMLVPTKTFTSLWKYVPATVEFKVVDEVMNAIFTAQEVRESGVEDAILTYTYKVVFEYIKEKWVFKTKEDRVATTTVIDVSLVEMGQSLQQEALDIMYSQMSVLMRFSNEGKSFISPVALSIENDTVKLIGSANVDGTTYSQAIVMDNYYKVLDIEPVKKGEGGDGNAELLILVTHAELVALRDSKLLVAGQKYRITDYITMINEAGKFSAEHPFDIIVTALSEDTLSAEASAIAHEGDTFYDNYDLSQWKLYYSLDNNFAKWGLTTSREESYLSNWGSLYNRGTATDEFGKSIHIYSADDGGAYWQGESLTRIVTNTITDYRDIVVKDVGGEELCLYDAYGNSLYKSLYYQEDDEEGNSLYYDDENYRESDDIYPVKIVGYGEEDDSGEIVVFVTGLDALFDNVYNGEITYSQTFSYQGDYSDLYIASETEFGTTIRNGGVLITKLFCSTDSYYYSCSQIRVGAYQHATEQGRGVIYRMVDEFGNDFPYDFYNIGIYDTAGYGLFTFGIDGWTNSVSVDWQNNLLQVSENFARKSIYLPRITDICRNTKIIAETGFSSVKLSYSTNNTIIIAAGDTDGATATIEMGSANNNRIECSKESQIKIGSNCVYNFIYIGGTKAQVVIGSDFQNNNINISTHFEVGNKFINNIVTAVQLKVDSDYVTRCIFKGNGAIRTEDTRGNKKGSVLCFADVTLRGAFANGEVLKLQYDGSTGTNIGLTGLKIHGSSFWRGKYKETARTVVIPTTHTRDSFEDLTIASNSSGEIKVYSETDLVQ